jgi:cyclic beta-1,2-glucan glucanotransferase
MAENAHLESIIAEEDHLPESGDRLSDYQDLRDTGARLVSHLNWLPGTTASSIFASRCRRLRKALKPIFDAVDTTFPKSAVSEDVQSLRDNSFLLYAQMTSLATEIRSLRKLPHVRTSQGRVVPRALALAADFLQVVSCQFDDQAFIVFCQGFQEGAILDLKELWALVPALKLILLEQIAIRGQKALKAPASESHGVSACVASLRDVTQSPWKELLEKLIRLDEILDKDPSGAYARMDYDSRSLYREELAKIASHSDCTEMEVAAKVVDLAEEARHTVYPDPRIAARESHVGYYIVAEGRARLCREVGCKHDLLNRVRELLRRHPDEFLLPGIAVLAFATITGILLWLNPPNTSPALLLLSMLILLLPCSQVAVQIMNYLIGALLPAKILPKLDFSEGIPDDCVTLVAVPTLLLNEKQVHGLVEDLEVRFLGNHDPNMYFALVSDLPDVSHPASEDSPLVELCGNLIRELNERYAEKRMGSFLLLHRHRVYNPREKGWMGWERKRGKLLDLNKLLRGGYDSFPVKVGDLSILSKVRFVVTLDSDTELPRGAAQRMVGTMAHPLHQAIIDPEKNIVVAGYGILQPRVGVSVQSTARSRLAAIYAGETGFDIYTRAVSDAYQDLYGEGSFTGKGIYEVDAVQRVLDRRFPRNSLLSHDLIEGAYARSGLASDIEVIEDYPSHYRAHNRRKHRWLRGDWQIAGWLLSEVPDESGARVPNPISLVSRWKILDNLRRSLVEPATFVLLLFGWLLPTGRPIRWTIATICILFIPVWFQLILGLIKAVVEQRSPIAHEAVSNFYAQNFTTLLTLIFLPHQMLLSMDAVVRALVRRMVTRERLLEWETAAESELASRRHAVDRYLDWIPVLALGVGLLVWMVQPRSLAAALPILVLWASSKVVSRWLNQSPTSPGQAFARKDVQFLRNSALHMWRYFSEFCTAEHNWLIPDNVQEEPPAVAARFSTTNLGLLLNARQVACEMGHLTVPEMLELTQRTLDTVISISKHHGHLLNWYDTRTLEPLPPRFISSVDNGNLLASLWTLQQGCMQRLREPLLQPALAEGFLDFLAVLCTLRVCSRKDLARYDSDLRGEGWLSALLTLPESILDAVPPPKSKQLADIEWFRNEARVRLRKIREVVQLYTPWWLPEFASLRASLGFSGKLAETISLQLLPAFIDSLQDQLSGAFPVGHDENKSLRERLQGMLPEARCNAVRLAADLKATASLAGKLGNDMDFGVLLDRRRLLMSVGFDVDKGELHSACYDLLATESRTAVFAAIAKEDVPQDTWFNLGRSHTLDNGRLVMVSWTGTMFEYLMPALWLRSYPNTLLERSRVAAVRSQQAYAANRGIPWGISESAFYKLDEAGHYHYRAFGIPQLAMMKSESNPLVISPYSTFLALSVDAAAALRNLRRMESMGWFGSYGFYEAADYTVFRSRFSWSRCKVVPQWMAHHQGMSLLSVANLLCDNVVQRWFHSDRRVQATELLLHEKPMSHVRTSGIRRVRAA